MFTALSLIISAQSSEFNAPDAWKTVSSRIRNLYWAQKSQPEKLERLLSEAEPKATAAKTSEEFNSAMDSMIAKFGDSHFDFLTKEDQGFYLFDGFMHGDKAALMPNIGAWFRKTTDGYTVQMVLNKGAAESAGLRKGDLIQTIDGEPFSPVKSLKTRVGSEAKLRVLRDKKPVDVTVKISEETGQGIFLNATRDSSQILERNGKKIAYMHLWTMANDKFKTALEGFVYGRAKDTDAFILDIRDGFGGRPEGYGDPFFRPEADLEWIMGRGGSTKQLFGYGRPLIVIINEGSRSAKEVFSYLMKKSKRATLVGNHTAGDVLGTSPNAVGDWAYIEIPMVDLKIDGMRLEHNPVVADIQVKTEFDESGKDNYLEKAIDVALQKISAK